MTTHDSFTEVSDDDYLDDGFFNGITHIIGSDTSGGSISNSTNETDLVTVTTPALPTSLASFNCLIIGQVRFTSLYDSRGELKLYVDGVEKTSMAFGVTEYNDGTALWTFKGGGAMVWYETGVASGKVIKITGTNSNNDPNSTCYGDSLVVMHLGDL